MGDNRNIKEIFRDTAARHLKNKGADIDLSKYQPKMDFEKLYQFYATVNLHSGILENMAMIDKYNSTVQVISTLMVQQPNWNDNFDSCTELIHSYFDMFTNTEELDKMSEEGKALYYAARDFVTNSCLVYYAVSKKDKEVLENCNKKISESMAAIFKALRVMDVKIAKQLEEDKKKKSENNNTPETVNNNNDITKKKRGRPSKNNNNEKIEGE